MDRLTRSTPDCAYGVRLGCLLGSAVITGCDTLLYNLHLAIEARCATLNKWYIGGQAHLVYMPPGLEIVQGIEDDCETSEP